MSFHRLFSLANSQGRTLMEVEKQESCDHIQKTFQIDAKLDIENLLEKRGHRRTRRNKDQWVKTQEAWIQEYQPPIFPSIANSQDHVQVHGKLSMCAFITIHNSIVFNRVDL